VDEPDIQLELVCGWALGPDCGERQRDSRAPRHSWGVRATSRAARVSCTCA